MSATGAASWPVPSAEPQPASLLFLPFRIVQAAVESPELIFFVALAAMFFRPPDLKTLPVDRIAFVLLLCIVALRWCVSCNRVRLYPASWPMLALLLLGLWGVLDQPYESEAWSLLAAKWIVPVCVFHLAGEIFQRESARRKLEVFSLGILVYLTCISIFTLFDLRSLIFPRFILDESLGIHADRARGPFLQAVANGVCLNLLALVALHTYTRRRLPRLLAAGLFVAVPVALLATRTRAVWLAAATSIAAVAVFPFERSARRVGIAFCIVACFAGCAAVVYQTNSQTLSERFADRSPVEFRLEMYTAGWQMFTERPLTGWGSETHIQPEIAKRISDFHPERYLFHNTYLELAVERGVLGLGLYAWLMVSFLRLGRRPSFHNREDSGFLGAQFRPLWPVLLGVYLLNASAVVMNYQFVNAYLFTIAGILSAQDHRRRTW